MTELSSSAEICGDATNQLVSSELMALAIHILGTQDIANAWLHTPALGLSGARPIDLLSSTLGSEQVRDFLLRMQHGIYQ